MLQVCLRSSGRSDSLGENLELVPTVKYSVAFTAVQQFQLNHPILGFGFDISDLSWNFTELAREIALFAAHRNLVILWTQWSYSSNNNYRHQPTEIWQRVSASPIERTHRWRPVCSFAHQVFHSSKREKNYSADTTDLWKLSPASSQKGANFQTLFWKLAPSSLSPPPRSQYENREGKTHSIPLRISAIEEPQSNAPPLTTLLTTNFEIEVQTEVLNKFLISFLCWEKSIWKKS